MSHDLPRSTDGLALFLDIDGTLIDIAPTPEAVVVPPDLPAVLGRLSAQMGGALAVLTGRGLDTIDRLFAPARLPAGAIHGTEVRLPGGEVVTPPPSPALGAIRETLAAFVETHPGALLEDKGAAVAIHFRADPSLAPAAETVVREAVAGSPDLTVQPGKMVFEIRPARASKGDALEVFMGHPAFAGRRPLAIGDDVTDESMFSAAVRLGGLALRVGDPEGTSAARKAFGEPEEVRRWLAELIR